MIKKTDTRMTTVDTRAYAAAMIDKPGAIAKVGIAGIQLETIDDQSFADLAIEYKLSAPILPLEEGQIFRGRLIGKGDPVEMSSPGKDPVSGVQLPGQRVNTWTFRHDGSGIEVRIMSGHQLDSALPSRVGEDMVLVKLSKKDAGKGRTVREWIIGGKAPQLASGEDA